MPKSKAGVTDWENAENNNAGEWESLASGFAPLWKPEKGNAIMVQPVAVHAFKIKKASKIKTPSFAIECILKGGSLTNFYSGKNNAVSISLGDSITIGSSYNLIGVDKLVVTKESGNGKNKTVSCELSKMSELLIKDEKSFRIVFNGQVQTTGPRKVNDYTVQVPKGYKDKFRAENAKF